MPREPLSLYLTWTRAVNYPDGFHGAAGPEFPHALFLSWVPLGAAASRFEFTLSYGRDLTVALGSYHAQGRIYPGHFRRRAFPAYPPIEEIERWAWAAWIDLLYQTGLVSELSLADQVAHALLYPVVEQFDSVVRPWP